MAQSNVKCVVVGDNGVGKTSLLITYTTKKFPPPEVYLPRVFDNYSLAVRVGDKSYNLGLWDTYKEEEHDRLRRLSYPETDILLVCFSVARPETLENVQNLWVHEIQHYCPGVPWLLVGTKTDLRDDPCFQAKLAKQRLQPVRQKDGIRAAKKLGAVKYMECSGLTQVNVMDIFNEVK
ncbi:hypothetical protein ACLOAV_008926 [Pseudogymnoascus australis]